MNAIPVTHAFEHTCSCPALALSSGSSPLTDSQDQSLFSDTRCPVSADVSCMSFAHLLPWVCQAGGPCADHWAIARFYVFYRWWGSPVFLLKPAAIHH